jgi:hypothetical protein
MKSQTASQPKKKEKSGKQLQIWQLFHSEEKEINELQENGCVKKYLGITKKRKLWPANLRR